MWLLEDQPGSKHVSLDLDEEQVYLYAPFIWKYDVICIRVNIIDVQVQLLVHK